MSTPLASHTTIVYITNRREPMIEWFFDSLHRECHGCYDNIKIVVVDFYADYPGRRDSFLAKAHCFITHIPPKPTVWQGHFRLTQRDYFAASNTRNTGIAVAQDGYVVFVDDISVLCPGWLAEVRRAAEGNYIACGTYQKVLKLVVDNGSIVFFIDHPAGHDTRMAKVTNDEPLRCDGGWLFGASFAAPLEALLTINGLDEAADMVGQGGEDYLCGIMLEKSGYELRFCPRMKTLESEERHYLDPPFKRVIKPGNPDASHVLLNMVRDGGRHRAPNYFDLRELRQRVLFENQPFPVSQIPQHCWFDGQPLAEL